MWLVHWTLPLSQNYGGLSCFLVLLPRSLVLVRCFREADVAIFAGGLVGVDKHLIQRVPLITSMTLPGNYIFVLRTRQCRCYSKTKTTKYCLKQEGKSHPCHPLQN